MHTGHSYLLSSGSTKAISTSAALPLREEPVLLPLIREVLEPRRPPMPDVGDTRSGISASLWGQSETRNGTAH